MAPVPGGQVDQLAKILEDHQHAMTPSAVAEAVTTEDEEVVTASMTVEKIVVEKIVDEKIVDEKNEDVKKEEQAKPLGEKGGPSQDPEEEPLAKPVRAPHVARNFTRRSRESCSGSKRRRAFRCILLAGGRPSTPSLSTCSGLVGINENAS